MFTSDQDRNPAVVIRKQLRGWEWRGGGGSRRRRRGAGWDVGGIEKF